MKSLENRFTKNPVLKGIYEANINDDIKKGYLRLCRPCELNYEGSAYFMPHHAVEKASSTSMKVRVVYDASTSNDATLNGKSLNDQLLVSPTVQRSIFDILLGWREHEIVMIADIQKMYKQIWVHPYDTKFQRILWQNSPVKPMKQYVSATVTFGTASAPFQATRTLMQIETNNWPVMQ